MNRSVNTKAIWYFDFRTAKIRWPSAVDLMSDGETLEIALGVSGTTPYWNCLVTKANRAYELDRPMNSVPVSETTSLSFTEDVRMDLLNNQLGTPDAGEDPRFIEKDCICTSYDLFNHGCASARGKRCSSKK